MSDIREKVTCLPLVYESSPSQVSEYELCPRKWAFQQLDGLRKPKGKGALFGIGVHDHLEKWLKKRLPPSGSKEAKVAQMILPHLPPPHLVDPSHVEMDVGIELDGVKFAMALDLWMPDLSPPTVYDHKSTSSFDWALKPELMAEDVQATLYAAWAMVKTGSSEVAVQWTYGLTKGAPDARAVRALLRREDVSSRVEQTVQSAKEMKLILDGGGSALEVPYDATACGAYGGCPFVEKCNLTMQERIVAVMTQRSTSTEEYLAQLRNRKGKNGAPATPGQVNPPAVTAPPAQQLAAPPPPAQTGTVAAAPANKLAARLAAKSAAAAATPQVVVETVAEPVAEPAPADTEEAPKRGRGRPAAEQKPATPADMWSAYASTAQAAIIDKLELQELVEPESLEGVAQTAGQCADAMLKEYLSRFGG